MKALPKRPAAFVLTSTDHGSMLVNRHDYQLVPGGGFGVGFQLLETASFDAEEVNFVLELLESRRLEYGDGVIAIDCGANIGVHTLEWARFMHGWGNVLAFEAQERIFYALAGNLTLNNCFNARAIWAAVGATNGALRVPVPDYFTPSSFGSLELRQTGQTEFIGQEIDYSDAATQLVQMMAIDSLGLPRLDLIKIDIEGMEMEALEGARASIARHKPHLLIEKIKSNEADIRRFVGELGYKVFPLGINLLAVHASDTLAGQLQADPAA
jgi:FkbM family methyltransferase